MTAVGEVVIARAHVTVCPRLRDAEARRVAGGWGVVQLNIQFIWVTAVASSVEVKIQLVGRKLISLFNNFKRQARTSLWFKWLASFLYPAHVCSVWSWKDTKISLRWNVRVLTERIVLFHWPSQRESMKLWVFSVQLRFFKGMKCTLWGFRSKQDNIFFYPTRTHTVEHLFCGTCS